MHQPISEEVKSQAVERVRNGESIQKVAASLGVTGKAVWSWCNERGVKSTHISIREQPPYTGDTCPYCGKRVFRPAIRLSVLRLYSGITPRESPNRILHLHPECWETIYENLLVR